MVASDYVAKLRNLLLDASAVFSRFGFGAARCLFFGLVASDGAETIFALFLGACTLGTAILEGLGTNRGFVDETPGVSLQKETKLLVRYWEGGYGDGGSLHRPKCLKHLLQIAYSMATENFGASPTGRHMMPTG